MRHTYIRIFTIEYFYTKDSKHSGANYTLDLNKTVLIELEDTDVGGRN